jgi:hypothetical protein
VTVRIAAAAIRFNGIVLSLPPPARHHNCLRAAHDVGYENWRPDHEQGFITNDGRFVDREEVARIAVEAGQLIGRAKRHPLGLFSEDVW